MTYNRILTAKNKEQKDYLRTILDNDITICIGDAGVGKDFVAQGIALEKLYAGKIKQIIATKPLVACGKGFGYLPGSISEKSGVFYKSLEANFCKLVGSKEHKKLVEEGAIKYEPIELLRGQTLSDAYIICSETQNCSVEQVILLITRLDKGSKIIFNGDLLQQDLKREDSGLEFLVDRLEDSGLVGISELKENQRNPIIAKILKYLDK